MHGLRRKQCKLQVPCTLQQFAIGMITGSKAHTSIFDMVIFSFVAG